MHDFNFYNVAPVGFITINENMLIKEANPAVCNLLGVTKEVLFNHPILQFIHPEDYHIYQKHQQEILEKDTPNVCELRMLKQDGSTFWTRMEGVTTTDIAGNLNCYIVMSDITKNKKAEEELHKSYSLLNSTLQSTTDAILVVDTNGKVMIYNQQFVKLWRIQESLIATQDDKKILKHIADQLMNPNKFIEKVKKIYKSPEAVSKDTLELIDGRLFESYSQPQRIDNLIVGRIWSFHDYSERNQAEKALHESSHLLQTLANNLPDVVLFKMIADFEGNRIFTYISDAVCRVNELTVESVMANANVLLSQMLPEYLPGLKDAEEKAVSTGENLNYDFQAKLPGGKIRWFKISSFIHLLSAKHVASEGVQIDITEFKLKEAALRESEERHRTILQTAMDGFWTLDMQGYLLEVNEAYCRMSGRSAEELLNMNIVDLEVNDTQNDIINRLQRIRDYGEDRFETRHHRKDGSVFDVEIKVQYRPTEDRLVVFIHDITEHKRVNKMLQQQAFYDVVTNLPNRVLFYDRLNAELARIHRTNKKITLLFIDIDGFKQINDTYGHKIGDVVLHEIADKLYKCIRETDTVARIGGDEFIIMLTDITDDCFVEKCATRILNEISKPIITAGTEIKTSVSIGITMTSDGSTNPEVMINHADEAMYTAKESGKNRFAWYTNKLNSNKKSQILNN